MKESQKIQIFTRERTNSNELTPYLLWTGAPSKTFVIHAQGKNAKRMAILIVPRCIIAARASNNVTAARCPNQDRITNIVPVTACIQY